MTSVIPLNDYLIIKVVANKNISAGGIIVPEKFIDESCTGVVIAQNPVSYYRNGDLRQPICDVGDTVVFAKKSGTNIPQSPDGEIWLAIPEDCIYYKILES